MSKNCTQRGILAKMSLYATDAKVKSAIDKIQLDLQCCGNTDYHDWLKVMWGDFSRNTISIPLSCCHQGWHTVTASFFQSNM